MTPEEIEQLQKTLEYVQISDYIASIAVAAFIMFIIVDILFYCYRAKKFKKLKEEYYASLNNEEKKKIKYYNEIRKL